jgi:hypothetical protein
MLVGNKFKKSIKTKFRKNDNEEQPKLVQKKKHHDKSYYRLVKQEREEYVN